MPNNEDIEAQLIPAGRLVSFLVVTPLFFLWAVPNNLNDILIRQFMKSFGINQSSAAQFLYVGAQVGTWIYFISYVETSTGVGDKAAGYMLTGTLAAFAVGRFSSAWLMKHFHARLMLVTYAVINVVLCLAAVVDPSWMGVGCLLTTSLFMSIMFPTIFALGLKGMGEKTKTAGSFQVMAILGGWALTKLMGMLWHARGLQAAYLVPVVCYVAVALYAWLFAEAKAGEAAG